MLSRARVYRNVELRQELLGLEPFDALGLGALGWLLMVLNRHSLGLNLLALALAYVGVRAAKRGQPPGHTTALVRFYLRRPFFSAAADDREGAAHPFPFGPARSGPAAAGWSRRGAPHASHHKGDPR